MNNQQLADVFDEIGDLLEFQAANPFRVRAYRNGARTLRDLTENAASIVEQEGRALTDIDGIGKDLADKITTLLQTGTLPMLEELRGQVPASVLALVRVPGLGPKKAAVLHKELQVNSLEELRLACEQQRVRGLKGFGAKTEQTILAGLEIANAANLRMPWAEADQIVQAVLRHLRSCAALEQIEAAGSYRRGRDTIGDLDFLAVSSDANQVMDCFANFNPSAQLIGRGDTKMSVRLPQGLQMDLRVVPAESFGAALQYFTGSKDHNVVVRGLAKDRGLKINEYGVYRGDALVAGATEQDIYQTLGLPWFPPEIREARREFDWARGGELPRLLEVADLVGDLHMHTTASDGRATMDEMATAARKRGLSYIAITDHSKRVTMANGLTGERLLRQWEEIDRWNANNRDFLILKGVEVDILEKGGLDIEDEVLAQADWVVASVHYGQNQPREQITARMLEAVRHPSVSAIAHPTGRLINHRKSYDLDLDAVLQAARETGTLMELNAHPMRLDLDDVACAAAKAQGIPIVINTDAHSITDLDKMRYGVLQARRAGLTKADVANTRPWAELKQLLGKR